MIVYRMCSMEPYGIPWSGVVGFIGDRPEECWTCTERNGMDSLWLFDCMIEGHITMTDHIAEVFAPEEGDSE